MKTLILLIPLLLLSSCEFTSLKWAYDFASGNKITPKEEESLSEKTLTSDSISKFYSEDFFGLSDNNVKIGFKNISNSRGKLKVSFSGADFSYSQTTEECGDGVLKQLKKDELCYYELFFDSSSKSTNLYNLTIIVQNDKDEVIYSEQIEYYHYADAPGTRGDGCNNGFYNNGTKCVPALKKLPESDRISNNILTGFLEWSDGSSDFVISPRTCVTNYSISGATCLPTSCSVMNAVGNGLTSVLNVDTVSGDLINGCTISTCVSGAQNNGSSCDAISCNSSNAVGNGLTSLTYVNTISGDLVNGCSVATCVSGAQNNTSSCSAIACNSSNAVGNGLNSIINVNTISGNLVTGCSISSCVSGAQNNGTTCDAIACDSSNAVGNGLTSLSNVDSITGNLVSGCTVSACVSGAQNNTNSCTPIACNSSNAVGNGISSLTHVATISGNLVNGCSVGSCVSGGQNNGSNCTPIACTTGNATSGGLSSADNVAAVSGDLISGCSIVSCDAGSTNFTTHCDQDNYHVFLVAGQSNAVAVYGTGATNSCGNLDTNSRILQYSRGINVGGLCSYSGGTAGTIIEAKDPLQHEEAASIANAAGVASSFAMRFAVNYLNDIPSNDKIVLVPVAKSSTSFTGGEWKKPGAMYTAAVTRTNATLSLLGPAASIKGIFWQQGETDANGSEVAQEYENNLKTLITNFRTDITGASSVPFVIGGLGPSFQANANYFGSIVHSSLQKMDRYFTGIGFADSSSLVQFDTFHFNSTSQKTLGNRYYSAFNSLNTVLSNPPITDITISNTLASANQSSTAIARLFEVGGTKPITFTTTSPDFSITGDFVYLGNVSSGTKTLEVTATDSKGLQFTKSFNITVNTPTITTKSASTFTSGMGLTSQANTTDFMDWDTSWTVNVLIKNNSLNDTGHIFSSQLPNTGGSRLRGVKIQFTSGQLQVFAINDFPTNYNLYTTWDKVQPNVWHKLTIVNVHTNSARAKVTVYLNGVKMNVSNSGSATLLTANHSGNFSIGSEPNPIASQFQGSMDELTFWDTAFSQADVTALVNNIDPTVHSKSANLRHRYQFETPSDSSSSITDTGYDPTTLNKLNAGGANMQFNTNVIGH